MYDSSAAFNMLKSHGKLGLTLKPRFGLKFSKYYIFIYYYKLIL